MERSQRKLRPSLPRLKDNRAEPLPPAERGQGRDASGRFAPGHKGTKGKGWKRALARLSHAELSDAELKPLLGDSASLFRAQLAELPNTGAIVSTVVAEGSRSAVLSAYCAARALEVGIETEKGGRLLELSVKLGQRAERTAVTAYDLSQRLAAAEPVAPLPGAPRRGELAARLAAAVAPAPTSAPSPKTDATTRRADASATHLEGDPNE